MIKILQKEAWHLNNIQKKIRKDFLDWINESDKLLNIENCPFCNSYNFKIISKVDRFGLNFQAQKCNNCNLIITTPQIKEEYLSEYYNKYYHPLIFGSIKAKDYLFDSKQGEKIFNITKKYLFNKKTLKVFEIGAASGNNLKGFQEKALKKNINCQLEGLEFSEAYVKKAKELGITLYTEDLETFANKKTIKYDLIILSHIFEHISDFNRFLAAVKKMMHKDSILYVEVPGILKLHKNLAYKCDFKRYLVHAHVYHFTAETLEKIFAKNQFKTLYINEMVEAVFMLNYTEVQPKTKSMDVEKYIANLEKKQKFYKAITFISRTINKIKGKIL